MENKINDVWYEFLAEVQQVLDQDGPRGVVKLLDQFQSTQSHAVYLARQLDVASLEQFRATVAFNLRLEQLNKELNDLLGAENKFRINNGMKPKV